MGERWKKINLLHFCLFTLAPSHRTSAQSHALRQSHHASNKTTPLRQSHHAPTKLRRSPPRLKPHPARPHLKVWSPRPVPRPINHVRLCGDSARVKRQRQSKFIFFHVSPNNVYSLLNTSNLSLMYL